jgi:hypothetical protein
MGAPLLSRAALFNRKERIDRKAAGGKFYHLEIEFIGTVSKWAGSAIFVWFVKGSVLKVSLF